MFTISVISNLVVIWRCTLCADDVTKEAEGVLAKLAFVSVWGDTGCLEALKSLQ